MASQTTTSKFDLPVGPVVKTKKILPKGAKILKKKGPSEVATSSIIEAGESSYVLHDGKIRPSETVKNFETISKPSSSAAPSPYGKSATLVEPIATKKPTIQKSSNSELILGEPSSTLVIRKLAHAKEEIVVDSKSFKEHSTSSRPNTGLLQSKATHLGSDISDMAPKVLLPSLSTPQLFNETSTTWPFPETLLASKRRSMEVPKLDRVSESQTELIPVPVEMPLSHLLSNNALAERVTTFDVMAHVAHRPDDAKVRLISTPEAIVSGVVDSIQLATSIGKELEQKQWRTMQIPYQIPESMSMYAFPTMPGGFYEAYCLNGKTTQPIGLVSPPAPPMSENDPVPLYEPLVKSSVSHSSGKASNTQRYQTSHQGFPSDMELGPSRSTLARQPYGVTTTLRDVFPAQPLPLREMTARGDSSRVHPRPTTSICPTCGVNPSIVLHHGSICPTCGSSSGLALDSPFSRYQLPSVKDLASMGRGQRRRREGVGMKDPNRGRIALDPPFREAPTESWIGESKWRSIERKLNLARAPEREQRREKHYQDGCQESTSSSCPLTPKKYRRGVNYEQTEGWLQEYPSDFHKARSLRRKPLRGSNAVRGGKTGHPLTRQRNVFEGGLTTYRRSPYRSLSDMATYYTQLEVEDQADVISLLLACRKLEKQIEEQHVVIDMLDHDLLQAQQTLRFPPEWQKMKDVDLIGPGPQPITRSLPANNFPLYLKGRVLLQQKEPPPGATFILEPDIAQATRLTTRTEEKTDVNTSEVPGIKPVSVGAKGPIKTISKVTASPTPKRIGLPVTKPSKIQESKGIDKGAAGKNPPAAEPPLITAEPSPSIKVQKPETTPRPTGPSAPDSQKPAATPPASLPKLVSKPPVGKPPGKVPPKKSL